MPLGIDPVEVSEGAGPGSRVAAERVVAGEEDSDEVAAERVLAGDDAEIDPSPVFVGAVVGLGTFVPDGNGGIDCAPATIWASVPARLEIGPPGKV